MSHHSRSVVRNTNDDDDDDDGPQIGRPIYIPRKRQRPHQQQREETILNRRLGAYYRFDDIHNEDDMDDKSSYSNNSTAHMAAAVGLTDVASTNRPFGHTQNTNTIYDYMDEQDHNEWGGPSHVRSDYTTTTTTTATDSNRTATAAVSRKSTDSLFLSFGCTKDTATIGERLLRHLGIRKTIPSDAVNVNSNSNSTAPVTWTLYISDHTNVREASHHIMADTHGNDGKTRMSEEVDYKLDQLSKRKIQHRLLQQNKYDNISNQPPSARNGTTSGVGYKSMSLHTSSELQSLQRSNNNTSHENKVHSTPTPKSMAGFALRDDDDEHVFDDDDDHQHHPQLPASSVTNDTSIWNRIVQAQQQSSVPDRQQLVIYNSNRSHKESNHSNDTSSKAASVVAAAKGAYNTDAYEHVDSDTEEDQDVRIAHQNSSARHRRKNGTMDTMSGVLSAWATTTTTATGSKSQRTKPNVSKDGPISGFVWGSSSNSQYVPTRFRGPNIPKDWEVGTNYHIFIPTKHSSGIHIPSNTDDAIILPPLPSYLPIPPLPVPPKIVELPLPPLPPLPPPIFSLPQPPVPPFTTLPLENSTATTKPHAIVFAGVSAAMKNRFSAASTETNMNTTITPLEGDTTSVLSPIGFTPPIANHPEPIVVMGSKQQEHNLVQANEPQPIPDCTVTRTMDIFQPEALLCKRFHVPVPFHSSIGNATVASNVASRTREERYFYDDIMTEAKTLTHSKPTEATLQRLQGDKNDNTIQMGVSTTVVSSISSDQIGLDQDEKSSPRWISTNETEPLTRQQPRRPSMSVYKSIFAVQLLESDNIDDSSSRDKVSTTSLTDQNVKDTKPPISNDHVPPSSDMEYPDGQGNPKEKKRRRKHRRRHDLDTDLESVGDRDGVFVKCDKDRDVRHASKHRNRHKDTKRHDTKKKTKKKDSKRTTTKV